MTAFELLAAFFLGGLSYGAIELLWRRRTHWTMVLTGGICFLGIYRVAALTALAPLAQYILCAMFITAVEFLVGAIVNVGLGWGVWDYSHQRFNLYGQVCALYALYWFVLSIPGCALARLLRSSVLGGL